MTASPASNPVLHDDIPASQLDGVRTARVFAFAIDYLLVAALCIPLAVVVLILGVLTLGLAWGLFAVLFPLVAIVYLATTLGGEHQATVGMRVMGVHMQRIGGGRIDPFLAILHGILFWVIHSVALILPLIVTFFSSKKRLLHDILLGVYVVRT